MEAKKCLRCGIFHLGNEDVCKTCKENEVYGGNEIKKNEESEIL